MKWHLLIALALGLGLILRLLWFLTGQVRVVQADPGIRYVAPDGDDAGLCDSIANRCRTVQRALYVADAFSAIREAVGVYAGTAVTVATIGKTVALLRGYDDGFTERDPSTFRSLLDARRNGRWPARFSLLRRLRTNGRSVSRPLGNTG